MTNAEYRRHGGPYDRGGADAYYSRPRAPHYYEGASYGSPRIEPPEMTPEQVAAYNAGFDACTDRKDWN